MSVALDAASAAQTFSNATSKSWTHTASGSNRCVWVCVAFYGFPSAQSVSSVTYGGVDITASAFGSVNVDYGGYPLYVIWYELKNPPTTTNATVEVTFSGASYGVAGSISCTGVDQTTAHGTPVTASGSNTGTNPNITVANTAADSLMLAGTHLMPTGNPLTPNVGTSCWIGQERTGTGSWGAASRNSGGGSLSASWTFSGSSWWSASAFEALAAASAPTNSIAPSCTPDSGTTADDFVFDDGTWTGSPTNWSWEYRTAGSGDWTEFSTSQNPTVEGSTFGEGSWNTRLTATNAGGSTTANGTTITVTAPPPTGNGAALTLLGVG